MRCHFFAVPLQSMAVPESWTTIILSSTIGEDATPQWQLLERERHESPAIVLSKDRYPEHCLLYLPYLNRPQSFKRQLFRSTKCWEDLMTCAWISVEWISAARILWNGVRNDLSAETGRDFASMFSDFCPHTRYSFPYPMVTKAQTQKWDFSAILSNQRKK